MTILRHLHLIPLTLTIVFPVAFVISYAVAVNLGHITPFFSYISDTGTKPPEQCIFGFFMNLASLPFLGLVYIRYKVVEKIYKLKFNQEEILLNSVSLVLGLLSALGISIVGNFQVRALLIPHLIGAALAFIGGTLWLCLQAHFSFHLLPYVGSKNIAYFRMSLGISGIFMYFTFQSSGLAARLQFNVSSGVDRLHWGPSHGGYGARVVSVVTEWLMLSFFVVYMLTFIPELRRIKCTTPNFFTVFTIDISETSTNAQNQQDSLLSPATPCNSFNRSLQQQFDTQLINK